jgi:hypothetical protein
VQCCESFTCLSDSQLSQVLGGGDKPKNDYSIDLKSLGAEMASGAVLGGLGAAVATGGPGWPVGAVGGAIGGSMYYSISTLINPPSQSPQAPSAPQPFIPWRPKDMAVCH